MVKLIGYKETTANAAGKRIRKGNLKS
jgi:hypothetical protein